MSFEKKTVLMPDYFDSFRCKCGLCRTVCCGGWGISLSLEEYFRLIGIDCSEELRRKLDCAFAVADDSTPERYALMQPSYDGRCRMIREDGLCGLQCECGEGVLPAVCRMYPRSYRKSEPCEAVCSCSCEGVTELLMRDGPLTFVCKEIPFFDKAPEYPALSGAEEEKRRELFKIFSSDTDIKDKMARAFFDGSKEADGDHGFAIFKKMLSALSPISPRMEKLGKRADGVTWEEFISLEERAKENIPSYGTWLSNIMANHFFYTRVPCEKADCELKIAAASAFAAVRASAVFALTDGGYSRDAFADAVSETMRHIEHTAFDKNSAAAARREDYFSPDKARHLAMF